MNGTFPARGEAICDLKRTALKLEHIFAYGGSDLDDTLCHNSLDVGEDFVGGQIEVDLAAPIAKACITGARVNLADFAREGGLDAYHVKLKHTASPSHPRNKAAPHGDEICGSGPINKKSVDLRAIPAPQFQIRFADSGGR
jgi:hypothetical protein